MPHLDYLAELLVFPPYMDSKHFYAHDDLGQDLKLCLMHDSKFTTFTSRALAIFLLSKKKLLNCIGLFELSVCFESTLERRSNLN